MTPVRTRILRWWPPRRSSVAFLVTRETRSALETLIVSVHDIDGQSWQALYRRNGELYLSQTCGSGRWPQRGLARQCVALKAPALDPARRLRTEVWSQPTMSGYNQQSAWGPTVPR